MSRLVKKTIKILLIFLLIFCWLISLSYANSIKPLVKTVTFYFEDQDIEVGKVSQIREVYKDINLVGWKEETAQSMKNPTLNRTADNLKVLFVKGNVSLIASELSLLEEDKDGCYIDEKTANDLFGSLNVVGKIIEYNNRNLSVRGIHNSTKANVVVRFQDVNSNTQDDFSVGSVSERDKLNGITIEKGNMSIMDIEALRNNNNIEAKPISGGIYYGVAKIVSYILPIIALILILINIIKGAICVKNKPVFISIYMLLFILAIYIFFKVTNIEFKIPLEMLPNQWSDFEFWSKGWEEYTEKLQTVLYMKKFGVDIYGIEAILGTVHYMILSIILFVINIKIIKIKDIKSLLVHSLIMVVCTFIAILIVNSKYNIDINILMVWYLYPLYICSRYFLDKLKEYNI